MKREGAGPTQGTVVGRVCAAAAVIVAVAGIPLVAASQINEKIEVITLSKYSTDTSLRSLCAKWTLKATDVVYFFRHAHPISGEEHHHGYQVYGCGYTGTVLLGGQRIEFGINAGWSGELGDTLYGGCIRECAALFQSFGPYLDDGV